MFHAGCILACCVHALCVHMQMEHLHVVPHSVYLHVAKLLHVATHACPACPACCTTFCMCTCCCILVMSCARSVLCMYVHLHVVCTPGNMHARARVHTLTCCQMSHLEFGCILVSCMFYGVIPFCVQFSPNYPSRKSALAESAKCHTLCIRVFAHFASSIQCHFAWVGPVSHMFVVHARCYYMLSDFVYTF